MSKEMQLELRKARIAVSPACNLSCNYCDGPKGRQFDKPGAMEDFRSKPIEQGIVDTESYMQIIQSLFDVGFRGVTLTGGEPFLNKDWDRIVREAKEIGMEQICVTTNGTLLSYYLEKYGRLPEELTLLTVSFDTFSPKEFASISQAPEDKHRQIVEGIRMVREKNPNLTIRANKITTRSGLDTLTDYIAKSDGLFDEINLLNLILKEPRSEEDKDFFRSEFVSPQEIIELLSKQGYKFVMGEKYEPTTQTPSGLRIIIKDTDQTLRSSLCEGCPIYCQEGFYTMRVGTDGSIRPCIDYKDELPYIDGVEELRRGTLTDTLASFMSVTLESASLQNTLGEFLTRYNIQQKDLSNPNK
jgi:cyclic pyranopterin phosphate synthase